MKRTKDSESGVAPQKKMTTIREFKEYFLDFKIVTGAAMAICMLSAVFAVTILAAHCAGLEKLYQGGLAVVAGEALPNVNQKLDRRGVDCNETELAMSVASAQVVTYVLDDGSLAVVTQEPRSNPMVSVTSIPISTQTATSTIYTVITPSQPVVVTETKTMTTSVLTSEAPMCSASTTVTVTITVVPTPNNPWASSSVLGDVTVTAGASTVTNVNTDVSYTSGLPDATISGNPSTVTDVDVSVTGLPDVTISGNPSTVTNVLTEVSLTSGLPDATVSGNPSTITAFQTSYSQPAEPVTSFVTVVISDLWSSSVTSSTPTDLVTVTAISTIKTTVTTVDVAPSPIIVTVTNAYSEPAKSTSTDFADSSKDGFQTSRQSTLTKTVTATNGQLETTTTTVFIPPVFTSYNGTASSMPTGTATSVIMPTIPVVVSSSNKGMEPRSHSVCFLIVVIVAGMSML
ncbi:hypothetical protein V8C43DRAFT_323452 [Trichoderma afarasin]